MLLAIVDRYKAMESWIGERKQDRSQRAAYQNITTDMMVAMLGSQERWREVFLPYYRMVVRGGQQEISTAFGIEFDVRNLPGEQWYIDNTLKFAQGVGISTEADLSALLQTGLREGWSMQTIGREIRGMFTERIEGPQLVPMTEERRLWMQDRTPRHRSEMIARTETINASTQGNLHLYDRWGVAFKEWYTTLDDRRCPFCAVMHGEIIQTGETFFQMGETMEIPRTDEAGNQTGVQRLGFNYRQIDGPPLHPNCRCTLLPYMPEWQQFGIEPVRGPDALQDVLSKPPQLKVREELFQIRDRRQDEYVALRERFKELERESKVAYKRFERRRAALGHPDAADWPDDLRELMTQYRGWLAKMRAVSKQRKEWSKETKQQYHALLIHPDGPGKAQATFPKIGRQSFPAGTKRRCQAAVDFVLSVAGPGINLGLTRFKLHLGERVRAFHRLREIHFESSDRPQVLVHELGHQLESTSADARRLARAFLARRVQGEARTRIYAGKNEYGWKDKFIDHYMGKDYGQGSTEIISMGLQYLYSDPVRLAEKDPEYFDLMMEIIGRI